VVVEVVLGREIMRLVQEEQVEAVQVVVVLELRGQ
jgi:hypothetical protein